MPQVLKYANVTQGSVEDTLSYMFDSVLSIPRVLNMLGLEYARILNMRDRFLNIPQVLNIRVF